MTYLIAATLTTCLLISAIGFVASTFREYRGAIAAALRGDLGVAVLIERPLTVRPIPAARRPVRLSRAAEWLPLAA